MSGAGKEPKKRTPRKSLRLPNYDYGSSGAYAFTICTKDRCPYFKHPILEQILKEEWINLPRRFVGITTDVFVVMPDHIHGMIWIDSAIERAPTLDKIIGVYKSSTSVVWLRYMKENNVEGSGKLWQRSFNDHIIRNEQDLMEKRNYALNNPIVAKMKEEQRKQEKK